MTGRLRAEMKCPNCGPEGTQTEFWDPTDKKERGNFLCPGCGQRGNKAKFTPKKQEAEG